MTNSMSDSESLNLKSRNITKDKTKLSELIEKQLNTTDSTPLNPYEIKNYIYYGFSDNEMRPKYWKLLFNYYSENLFKTEIYYKKSRKTYFELIKNIDLSKKHIILIDNLIKLDLNRIHFIKSKSKINDKDKGIENKDKGIENKDFDKNKLNRILLIFSTNNSEIGYIQGMINLIIPIYYVLSKTTDMESQKYIEEDTYNMFVNLMNEFGKIFIIDNKKNLLEKNLSNNETEKNLKIDSQINNDLSYNLISGSKNLQNKIENVLNIIKSKDFELYKAIIEKKLEINCFIAKWLLFMFSTEFSITDLLWLWDRILSDTSRFEILEFCCASVFILLRNIILTQEYSKCMDLIQNLSIIDVEVMFDISDVLRRDDQSFIKIIKTKLNK